VFKDALFVVPKWKAQALVAEMFAAAQLSLEKQRKELAQQHLSREKELKELAQQQLSRERELAEQQLSREKELKEQQLSREKELAEQQLSRERELTQQQLSREKELAEQQLSREKELTAREKQLTEQNKELTEQKVSMTDKLARLEENLQVAQREVLRSKGLLTSRGVLEMALIQVHNECKLKGKFSAQQTCFYLGKAKSTEQTAAWKLKKCHQEARDKHPHSNLLDESVGKAYSDLYGLLSEKIHGHPWSGESIKILDVLPEEMQTLIARIGKLFFGLDTEVSPSDKDYQS